MSTKDIKAALTKRKKKKLTLLHSGSTMLNMACSGRLNGGFPTGTFILLVGDSASGKTWLSMSCMAEASIDGRFDDYRFIFDDAENGALMNIEKYFGPRVAARLEGPEKKDGDWVFSETIEEFYYHLDDAIKDGRPFIYVLDSMDSLSSSDEEAKFQEHKKADEEGKKAAGSYGDGKAKKNSANLRRCVAKLKQTNSILIIINQTRDNIGFGAQFNPKTRSGGKALRFYAGLEIWTEIVGRITKTVKGKKRKLGITTRCTLKKNRLTGKESSCDIPLYYSHGIDDVGSMITYLIEEGHWKETKGRIVADEFEFKGPIDKLVEKIEEQDLESDLRLLVHEVWTEVENSSAVKRKHRYA